MNIRKAEIEDTARIAEIHVRSWQVAYKDSLPPEVLASLDTHQREAMWRSCIEKHGKLFVVEDAGSTIIGFLNIGDPRDEDLKDATELMAIYLEPNFYGSGIGTVFWKNIEKNLSTDRVYLWVLSTNLIGIAFYEKNGFRPDGKKKYFRIGQHEFEELRYLKHLPPREVRSARDR